MDQIVNLAMFTMDRTVTQSFRPVVGQLSEVVPFLLLQQRCGMACQEMLRRPRRCRCSRTG